MAIGAITTLRLPNTTSSLGQYIQDIDQIEEDLNEELGIYFGFCWQVPEDLVEGLAFGERRIMSSILMTSSFIGCLSSEDKRS
jgi:hypothetical protein